VLNKCTRVNARRAKRIRIECTAEDRSRFEGLRLTSTPGWLSHRPPVQVQRQILALLNIPLPWLEKAA
jgi:hypothetical protein